MPQPTQPTQPTPVGSAAGVKRIMKYKAIDHRANPASPSFRRSRASGSMARNSASFDIELTSPKGTLTSPSVRSPGGRSPGVHARSLFEREPTERNVSGFDSETALLLEVDLPSDEVVKDFYESELLLYRNFGVDQEAEEDATRTSRPRDSSRGSATDSMDSPKGRRRSSLASPVGDSTTFEAERRSAMRRRGSSVDGDVSRQRSRSPMRTGGDHRSPTSFSVNPSFTAFGGDASAVAAAAANAGDQPMFEVVPTTGQEGSRTGSSNASPHGASSRPTSRNHLSANPQPRRRSLRGSWCEYPSGAPRALTSSTKRTTKGISVVDLEQEVTRYTIKPTMPADWDGSCQCDEEKITRHASKWDASEVKFDQLMDHCSWCRRRPALFLCLGCKKAVCPSHVRAHAMDDSFNKCVLFINMIDITTSYDKIFWCEACQSFTFRHTDCYAEIADALVNTRSTYLPSAATDIFVQHYQVRDHAKPSEGFSTAVSQALGEEQPAVSMKLIASAAAMQGWRSTQEDSHTVFCISKAQLGLGELGDEWRLDAFEASTVFGVFDGHNGDAVARIASHRIEEHLKRELKDAILARAEIKERLAEPAVRAEIFQEALTKAFFAVDQFIADTEDGQAGYYGTVGCTALVVIVGTMDVACASAGDSRACLYDVHRAKVVPLSEDHSLDNQSEVDRVVAAGYSVFNRRIEGMLAVPRAFGDYDFKQCGGKGPADQAVSCEPMVTVIDRASLQLADGEESVTAARLPPMRSSASPTRSRIATPPEDWFVILACDGVWDVLSNENCCTLLNEQYQQQRRDKQLETYQAGLMGGTAAAGFTPASPMGSRSEKSGAESPPARRSRPGSLRGGQHHPANNVILYANTLNDIVAGSVSAAFKRCLALRKDEDDPAGLDNMSMIVARVVLTA